MLRSFLLFLAAAGLAAAGCDLPPGFAARAYSHIEAVVARSPRPVCSEGERKTVAYIREQFEQIGLRTAVEEFEFGSYEIENMQLRVGGASFRPVSVAFNPYAGVFRFEGLAQLADAGAQSPGLEDSYVISASPADFFRLTLRKPRLIVFVAPADFARLKTAPDRRFELTVTGHAARCKSANVTGEVGSPAAQRQIIVSAHLDAYRNNPGASDNASGVAVLIELARHFKSIENRLRARVKFVAFGAEEIGMLGARAYVLRHAADLRHTAFNLNIDDIGGPRCPVVDTQGGVNGLPERPGVNLFPADLMENAWESLNGDWRILDLRLLRVLQASNRPGWLTALIDGSARALGVKVIPTGFIASDQMAFTQAGVPATGIACASGVSHSVADTSAGIRQENLRTVGQLAACVVGAAAESEETPGERIARTVTAIAEGADSAQRRAAILRRLDELNLKYRTEDFCAESACGVNILVEPEPPRGKTLMLGAHYDRVSKGKGAVDNAAGVAAVLELLTAFKDKPLPNLTLAAAFFDREETGLLGSKTWVQRHELPAVYLNFDIFAYGDTLAVVSDTRSSALADAVRATMDEHKFPLIVWDQSPPSDDRAFRQAGVRTLALSLVPRVELEYLHQLLRGEKPAMQPALMRIVHSPEDTPEKVNGEEMARALRVVEAAIRAIDATPESPRRSPGSGR